VLGLSQKTKQPRSTKHLQGDSLLQGASPQDMADKMGAMKNILIKMQQGELLTVHERAVVNQAYFTPSNSDEEKNDNCVEESTSEAD
tara:strand:- start:153 stop:413 length:261 start_codon:yes stop_codon:yes gene_type:complete